MQITLQFSPLERNQTNIHPPISYRKHDLSPYTNGRGSIEGHTVLSLESILKEMTKKESTIIHDRMVLIGLDRISLEYVPCRCQIVIDVSKGSTVS